VVLSRDPEAIALASILTDCTDPLDQEGETYVLSGNVAGDCTVRANNITIDGLGLYSIGGNVVATGVGDGGSGFSVTVTDLTSATSISSVGTYSADNPGGDGGDITVINSLVTQSVGSTGAYSYNSYGGNGGDIVITNSEIGTSDQEAGVVSSIGGNSYYGYGGSAGTITITNSTINSTQAFVEITLLGGNPGGTPGTVTVVDNAPEITLLGEAEVSLAFEETYVESGATATDVKDGDLTDDIEISGTVGEEAGVYELTYTVADLGTSFTYQVADAVAESISTVPGTVSTTRTVTRAAAPAVAETPAAPATPTVTGGSTARGRAARLAQQAATSPALHSSSAATFQSLQARLEDLRTTLQSLQAPTPVFTRDLEFDSVGADVRALQNLLISKNTGPAAQALARNGATAYFGPLTQAALAEWQKANGVAPALGYFGPKTREVLGP
jgi:hypothetical protein